MGTYWRGVVDALNYVTKTNAESGLLEQYAMELLKDFAHSRGLQLWEGTVDEDSPSDYWPVSGGIGLTATHDGRLLIGWLSEVTTEKPLFYIAQ